MGKALDTAGLAAGRVALDANAEEVAQQFFDANFGTEQRHGHAWSRCDFELDDTLRFVTLSATRHHAHALHAGLRPRHDDRRRRARVIERETTGMELALVLDNTGSMWGSADYTADVRGCRRSTSSTSSTATRTRSTTSGSASCPTSPTVNIGPTRTGWLAAGDRVLTNAAQLLSRPHRAWKGCVMAQAYPLRHRRRRRRRSQKFTSFFYARPRRHGRQQLADDQDEHRRPEPGGRRRPQHGARPEPRLRLADHAAHRRRRRRSRRRSPRWGRCTAAAPPATSG